MAKLRGDLLILGAGGKIGPTLAVLARNAMKAADNPARVMAVSRFSDPLAFELLKAHGIDTHSADLLKDGEVERLPDAANVIFMAGRKFGTKDGEALTWAMNAWLPGRVAERYRDSSIVVFSTGNIYPKTPACSGGASEETEPAPSGEYAMSCLARERIFEHAAAAHGTRVALCRLNYAVDLRYGVLHDIAVRILEDEPVSLENASFNCIWQGDASEAALRLLRLAGPSVYKMNVTGPETAGTLETALALGKLLNRRPLFQGEPAADAYLSNSGRMCEVLGYPSVPLRKLIRWQAEWLSSGGRTLDRPTHFEERDGTY
jgi:nucleoside-diphosphate-sugar epimerase